MCRVSKEQSILAVKYFQCESASLQSAEYIRPNVPTNVCFEHIYSPHDRATQSHQTKGGTQVKFMFPLQHSLTIPKKSGNQADYTHVSLSTGDKMPRDNGYL